MIIRIRQAIFLCLLLGFNQLNAWTNVSKYVPYTKPIQPTIRPVKTDGQIFCDSIKSASKRLNVPYKWFLAICYNESMFNAKAFNKQRGCTATGIIQFTKSTARKLGTTTAKLRNMTNIQQIHYAELYFSRGIDKYGDFISLTDMYLWCLLPDMRRYANQPYKAIMIAGDRYYGLNRGLDENKDGKVQVYEITNRLNRKLNKV